MFLLSAAALPKSIAELEQNMNQSANEIADAVLTEYAGRTGEDLEALGERINPILNNRPLIDSLAGIMTGEDQVKRAQQQLDILAGLNNEQKEAGKAKWLELKGAQFADLNWKAALAGAEVVHYTTIGVATYGIALPSGGRQQQVRTLLKDAEAPTASEQIVLAWIHSVKLNDGEPQPMKDVPMDGLLSHVRKLPSIAIDKLAEICQDMEQWLNLTMESNLKNS